MKLKFKQIDIFFSFLLYNFFREIEISISCLFFSEAAKQRKEGLKERFEPLTKWMTETSLKDHILKAEISEQLESSPCALITSR